MHVLVSVFLFCLGAIIASFVGVVVVRYGTGQSMLSGRSRCDACGAPLPPVALIPVFSYALGRGRAACCGARISPFSTVAELMLGALFVLSYDALGLALPLFAFLVMLGSLLAIVEYDLMHQIIPPAFLAVFLPASVLVAVGTAPSKGALTTTLAVAIAFAVFFALLHFLSRGRLMGLADTPVVFGLALFSGPAAIPGFLFSFWIGAVIGIGVLLGQPPGSRMNIEVPLAPFLAAGFLLAYYSSWNPFALTLLLPYA